MHLLSVKSDRLIRWHYPGLLLIGDAAHVMSPVFGVGINYAIADAVELVNAATETLLRGDAPESALAEVQQLRERPTRIIQQMQAAVQERIVKRALDGKEFDLPPIAKVVLRTPLLRDIPARVIDRVCRLFASRRCSRKTLNRRRAAPSASLWDVAPARLVMSMRRRSIPQ